MKDNPMAVKLLALVSLVALATSHPTLPPDQASPVPSESSSNISPTAQSSHQKPSSDVGVDSKPSVEVEQFLKDMVNKMNKYRLMHATSPLVLSLNLTNKAELWAVKLANKDQEELNTNSKFGQAIFSTSNPDNAVNTSVESWYNQIVHYRFDRPVANPKTNYFTQLVWKASEDVGIGKASSASGKTYIVAYFSPPGNLGDMLNNVLPVTGSGVGKRGPANCTDDYKPYNNSCFKLFPGPRTWESAVHKCTQEFASLASVDSDAENYFIKSLLTTHQKNYTWIGLGDIDNDNTFTWVDGTSNVFTKWDYQQTNVNGKKCVAVGESFNWKYVPCDKGMSFVCRRRLRDVSIYEVVFLYLNKLWTDKLLSPEEPRYKALKTHIENAIFETYRDDDWFDEVDFKGFSKNDVGRILATTRIHFTPDDDSPLDPLEKLRNRLLQGDNGGETTKRTVIKGVLSGEPVEIVNTSLVIEHPQPVLCPGFCTIQNCPATTCSQSCCTQNSLNAQNPLGGLGYPGAQTQQPYQANLYQTNPYQTNLYQTNPYQTNPYQTNPYQTNPYQSNPYQGYAQSGYQSNYPYTGYSGPSRPQGGAQTAAKPEEKPGEEPEEKPDEKTKPSKEEDEATKEPKEQSKPSGSRPLRPVSRPVGSPQPYPSGYPTNYPGQSYSQQPSAQTQAYQQAAYPQTNPSLYQQANSPSYGYLNPSSYAASPYASSYPSSYPSPYQQNYQMYSPYSGGISTQQQYSITEKEKPGSAKGKKGRKKRPRQNRYRPYPYQVHPPPSYPGTYSSGYPGQLSAQAIPQMSQYMSTSPYTSQAAGGTGYQVMYGTSSYVSPSYQGAGYGSTMAGQNPYSQVCTGACANSCAPQCNPACCRSRGLRRMAH